MSFPLYTHKKNISLQQNFQNMGSVLARVIYRGYHYAGIYSHYTKFFAAMHFPLALHRNEAGHNIKKNVHKI